MATRIGVKDLEQSARELSELTGKDFRITPSGTGSGYNLVVMKKGSSGYNTVKNGMVPKDLMEWMHAYHAGIEEGQRSAIPPMPKPFSPEKGLRVLVGVYTVTIDDAEAKEADEGAPTTEQVKEWLGDAVVLDVDNEEYGTLPGFGGIELHHNTLTELPPHVLAKITV